MDELAQGRAILFMIVSAPFFAVGGLFFVLGDVWWPLRVVLAALIGLGIALGRPAVSPAATQIPPMAKDPWRVPQRRTSLDRAS
jgi:hypothetical protein